jgi:TRAP-type C4-dicarboxylate transport system permease small subunit
VDDLTNGATRMPRINPGIRHILDLAAKISLAISGVALVVMTVIVGAQVTCRYLIGFSLTWVEPLAIQLMGWFIFMGAAVGIREGFHLSLDLLRHFASPRLNAMMDACSMVVVAVFGGFVFWYGLALVIRTWDTTISGLGIPGGWDFMPLVFSGILMSAFALERLLDLDFDASAPAEPTITSSGA